MAQQSQEGYDIRNVTISIGARFIFSEDKFIEFPVAIRHKEGMPNREPIALLGNFGFYSRLHIESLPAAFYTAPPGSWGPFFLHKYVDLLDGTTILLP